MNFEKINNSQWDMNYASVSFVIQWINSTGHLDIVDMGWSKNPPFIHLLFDMMSSSKSTLPQGISQVKIL